MRVSDFNFDLPEELIAQHPPAERGSSRMLVLDRATGALIDERFANLPKLLRAGDLLVLNDSRVLPARLFARRGGSRTQQGSPQPSGLIEVLLTEQVDSRSDAYPTSQTRDAHPSEQARRGPRDVGPPLVWRALIRPARKVQMGEILRFFETRAETIGGNSLEPLLIAEVVATGAFGERTLRFAPVENFYGTLARIGHMPLPPYIRREQASQADSAEDRERYQTVYSQPLGSAAAPTAGLHFTPEILAALGARGVEIQYLTLHVGLGTFQPVRVERVEEIRLHAERYTLPAATAAAINRALDEGRRIIAAGTTTARTLEHIAAGAELAGEDQLKAHSGATSIFLAPGHRFRIVNGLLTNFHLPQSTLLMLVAAFAGAADRPDEGRRAILEAYAHAIREGYRFYSYGDCMLLL